jgi:uncharacterized protein YbjT (DUF2867 family)
MSVAEGSSILVVGATGSIGSSLVRQLAAAGVRPRALVRSHAKGEALKSLATPVVGDLSDPGSLSNAFSGVDRLFILAPPVPEQQTLERNALDAALAARVRHIVFLSNYGAAIGDEDLHFHVHGLHESYLASFGIEWTVLRPTRFMNYTPYVWRSVLGQGLLIEAPGTGQMTVIDPDDVAAVAVKTLTEDGHTRKVYDLTSNDSFSTAELARILGNSLGREIRLFEGDLEALRAALVASGAPAEFAPLMASYFKKVEAGMFRTTDTVERLLGRPPKAYAEWLGANLPVLLNAA